MKHREVKENSTDLLNLLFRIEDTMNMFAKDAQNSSQFSVATGEAA